MSTLDYKERVEMKNSFLEGENIKQSPFAGKDFLNKQIVVDLPNYTIAAD